MIQLNQRDSDSLDAVFEGIADQSLKDSLRELFLAETEKEKTFAHSLFVVQVGRLINRLGEVA